jgi:hypothetical protein
MKAAALLIACSLVASCPATGQNLLSSPQASEQYAAQRANQQLQRIKALQVRGMASNYASLRTAKLDPSSFDFPVLKQVQTQALADRRDAFEDITINETAINLAALGFNASDITNARRGGIDLAKSTHRLFSASSTPEEQVLLADTVVVARALPALSRSPRQDGFLSELRFEVLESIKGTSSQTDQITIPLRSGTNPDGTILRVTSEPAVVPGETYLLVLSKNWYQQLTVESGKKPSAEPSATAFSVYQLTDDGTLLHHSSEPIVGRAFRSMAEVARVRRQQDSALQSKD